jgi:hypothetical protein
MRPCGKPGHLQAPNDNGATPPLSLQYQQRSLGVFNKHPFYQQQGGISEVLLDKVDFYQDQAARWWLPTKAAPDKVK